jgi:ribonuclease VapC
MIVDSSALVAMMLSEPESQRIKAAIGNASCRLAAPTYLESSMVLTSRAGLDAARDLDMVITYLDIEVVPFTRSQASLARDAFHRFGKGRHPAGLNFGDCMAYALAKETGEELLFKGTDFAQTDIAIAAY